MRTMRDSWACAAHWLGAVSAIGETNEMGVLGGGLIGLLAVARAWNENAR
jgi:threonine dehydrogenase-like Zn-dependent dehydrogenase